MRNLRLFKNDIRESLTRTPWWLIPLIYVPLATFQIYSCIDAFSIPMAAVIIFLGFFSWTFVEYVLHRFMFHCEDLGFFPRNTKVYALHFLVHGIHHAFP